MQQRLVEMVKRYPFVAGILFALIATVMVQESEFQGQLFARFEGGPPARAIVARTFNAAGRPILPDYRAEVRWFDPAGTPHDTTLSIGKREFDRLEAGDEFPVIVARDDPGSAISEARLRNAGVFHVLGRPATGIGVVGVLMGGAALALCAWGLYRRRDAQ